MAKAMGATRGDARRMWHVFHRTLMPMVLFDNDRVNLDVNRATRLLFRLSLAEIQGHQLDELTPAYLLPTLHSAWERLHRRGVVAGTHELRFPDASRLLVLYAALANVLPGQHLAVFAPADWPEDELGPLDIDGVTEPLAGPLSPRELEVMTWIAAGYDYRQIADELTLSPTTVRTHLRNAMRKLHARNRPHAVAVAMHLGLIDLSLKASSED